MQEHPRPVARAVSPAAARRARAAAAPQRPTAARPRRGAFSKMRQPPRRSCGPPTALGTAKGGRQARCPHAGRPPAAGGNGGVKEPLSQAGGRDGCGEPRVYDANGTPAGGARKRGRGERRQQVRSQRRGGRGGRGGVGGEEGGHVASREGGSMAGWRGGTAWKRGRPRRRGGTDRAGSVQGDEEARHCRQNHVGRKGQRRENVWRGWIGATTWWQRMHKRKFDG